MLKKTDGRNITITHSYDSLHRLIGKTYSNGEPAVGICYDLQSCTTLPITNGVGQRLNLTDASGSSAWSYDANGRVVTARQTILGTTKTVSYGYNLAGSTTSITYPSGRRIDYGYDSAGRQLSAVDSANAVNYVLNASYAPQGRLQQALFGNDSGNAGTTLMQTFNSRLQPLTIRASNPTRTLLDLTYNFNLGSADNGNVARITNHRDNSRTQAFSYDQLNRVSAAWTPNSTLWGNSFVYDIWGNLLQKNPTQGTTETLNVTTNNKNQIVGYCYDAAGNLLNQGACGTPAYNYNADGQMTSTAGLTFTYDGDGRRVSKSGYRHYWFGSGSVPLAETYIGGVDKREYIFFAGRRVAHLDLAISGNNCQPECTRYYYYPDHLGSTAVLAHRSGDFTQHEADFYPFGGERVIISSSIDPKYRFTGKERDSETGLDFMEARYYGSSMGRFMSPDPDQESGFLYPDDPQAWNGYAYARNNPLLYTDPTGRSYEVCQLAERGKKASCGVVTDPEFERLKRDRSNYYASNGNVYSIGQDGAKSLIGTFRRIDVDLSGNSDANRQAAAMIVAQFNSAMAEFGKNAALAATGTLALRGVVSGVGAVSQLNIFRNIRVVVNVQHAFRAGHVSVSADKATRAVEAAIQSGNYRNVVEGTNQLIRGEVVVDGVKIGFKGKLIGNTARVNIFDIR